MLLGYNNRSILVTERIRALFKRIQTDIALKEKNDLIKSLEQVQSLFSSLYLNLGKPSLQLRPFEPEQVPRSAKLNLSMKEIEQDLGIAYKEVEQLGNGMVEVFNYSHAASQELLNASNRLSSKVVDLRILAGQQDQNVLVAGDDFNDTSRVDMAIGLQNPRADVSPDQGIVTLNRVSSSNLVNDNTQVKVTHLAPQLETRPVAGNVNRFYEGNFYNFIGDARPEGGRWHLEESLAVHVQPTGITTSTHVSSSVIPGSFNLAPFLNQGPTRPGERLRPEDVIVYDRGASEGEKQIIRAQMVDANPSSFWECEYVKTQESLQRSVEASRLITRDPQGNLIAGGPGTEAGNLGSTVTLDDLRNQARIVGIGNADDLVVEIVFTLDSIQPVNWISVNPNNFEDTAWLEVLDIAYSTADAGGFRTIPDFNNNVHDNVLTDQANAELTDDEAGSVLAPNRFAYKGIGVWNFEAVNAKAIKIKLRQRSPIPAPYQRVAIQLHRTFTQVYTETEAETPGI